MNKIIIGGVALALVLSIAALTNKPTETVVERIVEKQVGATPGTDVTGNTTSVGGVRTWQYAFPTKTATSSSVTNATFCSIRSPAATTTLVAATLRGKNVTGANAFEIGLATNQYATTTRLGIKAAGSGLPFEIVASTTEAITGHSGNVIIPNTYINFKVATATPFTGFDLNGQCVVVLREL
jgi:hypothetical protein